MKKNFKYYATAIILSCTVLATGCSASESGETTAQTVDGLEEFGEIVAYTREEGSGTRETFAELVGLSGIGEDGRSDLIRADAEIAMNAEQIIEEVKSNSSGIGFVSMTALTDEVDGIKVVSVDGITPTDDTVEDGSYPLDREFYLAYSGSLSELEEDFYRFAEQEGENISKGTYEHSSTSFLASSASGEITIEGSTSAASLMESIAEEYMKLNPNAEITISKSDSSSGLTAAMQGSCSFAMSSRELKDYEKELLEYTEIAKDGIAIIVNESNPVTNLTISQLTDIFGGEDIDWVDIND